MTRSRRYLDLVCQDFMLELSNKQLDVAKQLANCVQGECKPSKC